MNNKEDIISINTDINFKIKDVDDIPEEDKQTVLKNRISTELTKFIVDHFDELPINYQRDTNLETGEEKHKIRVDLVNNLVPVTLTLEKQEFTVYIRKGEEYKFSNLISFLKSAQNNEDNNHYGMPDPW